MTHWHLEDGTRVAILTFLDDHSRFALSVNVTLQIPMLRTGLIRLMFIGTLGVRKRHDRQGDGHSRVSQSADEFDVRICAHRSRKTRFAGCVGTDNHHRVFARWVSQTSGKGQGDFHRRDTRFGNPKQQVCNQLWNRVRLF
jgi:hypothetical protein